MRAVARYAFFNARVALLAGRLLPRERLAALIDALEEQEREVLGRAGLDAEAARDPVGLESALITLFLADLVALVRALTGPARDFFIYWAHRFEVSNLKAIIRGKLAGEPVSALREQLTDIGPYATLPLDELLNAEDIPELLRRLERTPYYADMARQARRIFEERRDLFALDAALDRRYYAGLSQRAQAIKSTDGRNLQILVGSLIDRINLVWLLRYRFAYHLPPAEAYYLLIPASYRLSSRRLLELAELTSVEEIIARLPAPFTRLLANVSTIPEVTDILRHWTWQLAETMLKHGAFDLARGFAYLLLRDRELRRIRAVLKGKRLGIEPSLIRHVSGVEARYV
ncbi:V-type ATPase subunit [Methylocaldum sp. 14B]|uniref:V-type ATPase subunit n=1 Tax=Methylocaldum sp. 14B TaxID=1912213 RepID=UPI00098AD377|nr:V-type ATPase subunit [Methylocaldum sp. 14B]